MAWSYDPRLISPYDQIRFKIGDTVERAPLFSNEEIIAIYARNNSVVIDAAVELMRGLVMRYARMAGAIKADDVSKETGGLYKQYKEQLDGLLVEQQTGAGTTTVGQLGAHFLTDINPPRRCP